jgi:hypothetical protein
MLRVPFDKLCVVIAMAREAMGKEPAAETEDLILDDGDEEVPPADEDEGDDPGYDALFDYVDSLNSDELGDLLALVWVGRGDFDRDEWSAAQNAADEEIDDGDAVAEILQDPTLPDDLIAGLEELGYDCPEE